MERRDCSFRSLSSKLLPYKSKALTNPLFQECLEIRRKFLETDMHQVDYFTWRIVNDFMDCIQLGWHLSNQQKKVREAILKYGSESIFWKEVERTRRQRQQETNRLAFVRNEATVALKKGGLKRDVRKEFSNFKGWCWDVRKKLLKDPLTREQWKVVWKIERLLGIYYTDLTDEENGIFIEGDGSHGSVD